MSARAHGTVSGMPDDVGYRQALSGAPPPVFAPAIAIQVLQLVVYPMPLGSWFFGVVIGLLAALVALGMALDVPGQPHPQLRPGRPRNGATVLAVGLIAFSHVGYFAGFFTGLAVSLVLGGTGRVRRDPAVLPSLRGCC